MHAWLPQLANLVYDVDSVGWIGTSAIALGLLGVVYIYTLGFTSPRRATWSRGVLLLLRFAAVCCVAAALLHPRWVSQQSSQQMPLVAVVLDDSASMQHGQRFADAVAALETLRAKFKDRADIDVFDAAGARVTDDLPTEPTADSSPLQATLAGVGRALTNRTLRGIVLLSDGRQTGEVSGDLQRAGVPVTTVDVTHGDTAVEQQPDFAIQAVNANERALVGHVVRPQVVLAATGNPPPQNVALLVRHGRETVARKVLRWEAGEFSRLAEIEFTPDKPGRLSYMLELRTAGQQARRDNDRAILPLHVRRDPLTVLFIDGMLGWEGKFIREALATDPDINVVSHTRTRQPASAGRSRGYLTADQLADVDVVIFGDIEPTFFSNEEIDALKRFVTAEGGGLLVTGGYISFAIDGLAASPLRTVVPVEFRDQQPTQRDVPFNLKLTDTGREHPIFHLSGDRIRDVRTWHALPKLSGSSVVAGIKPGAQVLAVNEDVSDAAHPDGLPVMVVQQAGDGRSMVFAVDTTWKWRTIVGGFTGDAGFYQRFWGQTVRWLASDDQAEDGAALSVVTPRERYEPGQSIDLTVQLPRADGIDYQVRAAAFDESGDVLPLALTASGSGRFVAQLSPAAPGRIDVHVEAEPVASDAGSAAQPQAAQVLSAVRTIYVTSPDVEQRDTRPDRTWLQRVAQVTGGQYLTVDELDRLAIDTAPVAMERKVVTSLWRHPWLIGLFFVLVCSEWALRRLWRLA